MKRVNKVFQMNRIAKKVLKDNNLDSDIVEFWMEDPNDSNFDHPEFGNIGLVKFYYDDRVQITIYGGEPNEWKFKFLKELTKKFKEYENVLIYVKWSGTYNSEFYDKNIKGKYEHWEIGFRHGKREWIDGFTTEENN